MTAPDRVRDDAAAAARPERGEPAVRDVRETRDVAVLPADLADRARNPAVRVLDADAAARLDRRAVVEPIVWGWKRDAQHPRLSRTIYFGGRLALRDDGLFVEDPFLFYAHWGSPAAMAPVVAQLATKPGASESGASATFETVQPAPDTVLVRIISGRPTAADLDRLGRLAARRPDPPPATPPRVPSSAEFDLRAHRITACDLLAGSGLSYEAGLPMLKAVHDLFEVDDGHDGFRLGGRDGMPALLRADLDGMFRRFASWHVQAARAQPSAAHHALRELRRAGFLRHVYTDNVDRLFAMCGMADYVQVRGPGVVNERFAATFHADSDALLVVGVSADRRGIIEQARERGLRLVVVNPYFPVSPGAKNLNYLRDCDVYFRLTAGEALPRIVAATLRAH